ncbi:hypothetical protein C1646_665174 [Rhizophagus diaphanus]|nr:hypothetical protein C1646_665174 [Rhizophagus diaphanus] [Rhizophagus sp. MUCL 43196]
MENQESSANTEVPFDVEKITADDIHMEGIEGMEDIINTSTQSRDIYERIFFVKSRIFRRLNLMKLSQIMGRVTPNLTEDPPRSLILNVCGDMIHRTCARGTDKRGTLYCSCGKDDDSDPLLPPSDYDDVDLFEETCNKCSEVIF